MSQTMIIGLAVGVVLAVLLVVLRRAQPVLLPVVMVLGVAGLTFAVQWQKEQDRRAHAASDAALAERATAAVGRDEGFAAPGRPPVIVPLPSPLDRPATGAAAPPAVRSPYRAANPS
jgi:hypothetical protein